MAHVHIDELHEWERLWATIPRNLELFSELSNISGLSHRRVSAGLWDLQVGVAWPYLVKLGKFKCHDSPESVFPWPHSLKSYLRALSQNSSLLPNLWVKLRYFYSTSPNLNLRSPEASCDCFEHHLLAWDMVWGNVSLCSDFLAAWQVSNRYIIMLINIFIAKQCSWQRQSYGKILEEKRNHSQCTLVGF